MTNFIFYSLILLLLKCHSKHIKQGTRGEKLLCQTCRWYLTLTAHSAHILLPVRTKLYLNAEGVFTFVLPNFSHDCFRRSGAAFLMNLHQHMQSQIDQAVFNPVWLQIRSRADWNTAELVILLDKWQLTYAWRAHVSYFIPALPKNKLRP